MGCCFVLFTFLSAVASVPRWFLAWCISLTAMFVALFWSAGIGFGRWRKFSRWWFVPAALCFLFLASAWGVVVSAAVWREREFRRHLGEYEAIVERVRSGERFAPQGQLACRATDVCPVDMGKVGVAQLPPHVVRVDALRCRNGEIEVWFRFGGDGFVLHEGFLYKGYEDSGNCAKEIMGIKPRLTIHPVERRWFWYYS